MNLLLLATGVPEPVRDALVASLHVTADALPGLDRQAAWRSDGPDVVVAAVPTDGQAAHPRRYAEHGEDEVVLYDGTPVSTDPAVLGHRAESLARSWDRLEDVLEGRYAVARVRPRRGGAELLVDPLGMQQVYALRLGDGLALSTSAGVLARVAGPAGLDLEAAADLAALAWVGQDRTLHPRVRVLPAGARVVRRPGQPAQVRPGDVVVRALQDARRAPRGLRDDAVREAAASVAGLVRTAGTTYPEVTLGLTAGRDSRVLVALLRHGGVKARHYTYGAPEDTDVRVAGLVADALGLAHAPLDEDVEGVVRCWDGAVDGLLARADGLATLRHLGTPLEAAPGTLPVRLSGSGGETARAIYATPGLVLGGGAAAGPVRRHLQDLLLRVSAGVATEAAREHGRRRAAGYLDAARDAGLGPFDAMELAYVDDRVRRWASSVDRAVLHGVDVLSPLATRPWLRAGYALRPDQRYAAALHRAAVGVLDPELLALPMGAPWPRPQPYAAALEVGARRAAGRLKDRARRALGRDAHRGKLWRHAQRARWFEQVLPQVRATCLDRTSSPLWSVVDRPALERLLAPSTPPEERLRRLDPVLDVVTLFTAEERLVPTWGA
ncbi:hypothetical protein [Vallicoccus soli]|uniref:Asparagine synthetase domain-containing protein n=1 Tax=Vallicoccus soli TaxID=2339232 RepID=A0A3A3YV62_9ACTN|nr:hypothetical protein [Vallicoccus soli]RJK92928.1 hypothetical protein D5H78_17560 [Vallicoccus soli]